VTARPKKWERLPAVAGGRNPCLNCPPIVAKLDMRRPIAVGFGDAHVSRDGETIYREEPDGPYRTVQWAENRAKRDPRHDWRIVLDGPLHGETYQRQGPGYWVLVARNQGFA